MTIKRFNNAFGTTTDSPLSSTATTMNSAELPRLGAIATSGEFARVTLDPGYENGDPEIIHVTDYDGTATSATIERGKEGTTAREHASGTTWEHAPTVEDVNAGDASGTDTVAIHPSAVAEGNNSVAIGANTTDNGSGGNTIIGHGAVSLGSNGVAVGRSAQGSTDAVAIGDNATSKTGTVAIGHMAEADTGATPDSVAIGDSAVAGDHCTSLGMSADSSSHFGSVALGERVVTSDSSQVHIGDRHLALDEISDPATPPADEGRLYFRDDGSGTTELAVIYPDGTINALRDSGSVLGGDASGTDAIAVGAGAVSDGAGSILIGSVVTSGVGSDSVGIGNISRNDGTDSIAVGNGANADSDRGIAIGSGAHSGGVNLSNQDSIAIGTSAGGSDVDANSISIGNNAYSGSDVQDSIAIGASSRTNVNDAIAIGRDALGDHSGSVAIGSDVSTSAASQTHLGARHLALDEISDPATPPADEGRLYFRDDGSGNTELVALFPSGNSTVLANGA